MSLVDVDAETQFHGASARVVSQCAYRSNPKGMDLYPDVPALLHTLDIPKSAVY
jgi:hypothetical protein